MNALELKKDKIIIELSLDELGVLSNSLNEVCDGIEVWEFDTRIGTDIKTARVILKNLSSIYREYKIASNNGFI